MHRDLLLAWRHATRRPGFTLLVVLTLALGIGVNSAVFALLDGVLLRPLPYRDPSHLVFLWLTLPQQNITELEATPWDYDEWHSLRSISELGMAIADTSRARSFISWAGSFARTAERSRSAASR